MFDVHPPREIVHTWKDFFIHIATIAVGLLIAIGLEQTVEYFHHRHQLQAARAQLSGEFDDNREVLRRNLDNIRTLQTELDGDVAVIRDYQSSHTPLKGKLDYSHTFVRPPDGAWRSVSENGVLGLMPYAEMDAHNYFYETLRDVMDSVIGFTTPLKIAAAIANRSSDGNLTSQDIDALIATTSEAQGKVAITAMLLGIENDWFHKHGQESGKTK